MIDIHSHIIPNVDDGSRSIDDSLEMIKNSIAQGCSSIICTPHFLHKKYVTPIEEIKKQFELLKEAVKAEGLDVDLYLGQEITYSSRENILAMLDAGELLTINGSKYVLIEFSFHHRPDDFEDVIYRFNLHKYHPILAHIERYEWMTLDDLRMLRNFECSFQVNANALIGKDGCKLKRLSKKYLKKGYVDYIASDMHYFRPSNLGSALKKVKNSEYFTRGELLITNK